MRAEVISVGTELLLGQIVDTNTPFIAEQLALMGMDLHYTSSVGDNYQRLVGVLKQAWQRSELVITTGGLGPTEDDITRETIAGLLGEKPEVDQGLKQSIVNYFGQRGLDMPLSNIKQATLIPSATALLNPQGTAPGWWVEKDGRIIVAMPGPPHEMQFMWQNAVFPRLQQKIQAIILSRTIKTSGLTEARVDEMVARFLPSTNPTLATYAKRDGIYLRITAKAAKPEKAEEMIAGRQAEVEAILGDYIWGLDNDTPESVAGQLLLDQGLSIAVAECFTAGFLTYTLAGLPRSREFLKGGVTAVSDEAKITLGIDRGMIASGDSKQVAAAMASLARSKFGADIGIGIDGYTELADGVDVSKVAIAIDSGQTRRHALQSYSGRYYQMRRRAAYYALFDLRKLLVPAAQIKSGK